MPKAVVQAEESGRAVQQLRRLLTGEHLGEAAAPPPPPHPGLPVYRMSFFNEFARSSSVIRACQRTITIRSARSPERAVQAAKKRFARIDRLRDWWIRAQIIEVAVSEPGAVDLASDFPIGCRGSDQRSQGLQRVSRHT